jgi:septal ring factor EnvC (AmiA/AmiB activator)
LAADKTLVEEKIARQAAEQELRATQESNAALNQELQATRDSPATANKELVSKATVLDELTAQYHAVQDKLQALVKEKRLLRTRTGVHSEHVHQAG